MPVPDGLVGEEELTVGDRREQGQSRQETRGDEVENTDMSREEWIAYLAGRETPAYAGWADNLPAAWRDERPRHSPEGTAPNARRED